MPSSPDILQKLLTRFVSMVCSKALESIILSLPDCWDSCNPSKISSIIWLLYYDKLPLHFSHNKCFWLLQQHYGQVQTHRIPELDYVISSSVYLSTPTQNEAMHTMSVHYYTTNHRRVPSMAFKHFSHIYTPQTNTYQDIAKLWTDPSIIKRSLNATSFLSQLQPIELDQENSKRLNGIIFQFQGDFPLTWDAICRDIWVTRLNWQQI